MNMYKPRAKSSYKPRAKPATAKKPYPKKTYYKKSYPRKNYAGSVIKTIGTLGGGAIGSAFGGPAGGALGSAVGGVAADLFKQITGMGDYNVKNNSLFIQGDSTPMFRNSGRSVRITHREYISDIITSSVALSFKLNSFLLNPATSDTYPWLATIAQQFEQYRIHGMVFHFKSNSADALNSTNTALGSVIMATQYNVQLPVFTTKQQMENYEFACSSRPSCDLLHPVECDPSLTSFGPVFDIRLGGDDGGDQRLYDLGRFCLATVGMQAANVNIGELWVSYDIELLKPRMGDTVSVFGQWRVADPTDASPFLDAVISEDSDFFAIIGTNTITFPANFNGNVLVWYKSRSTLAATQASFTTVTLSSGITRLGILTGGGSDASQYATGSVSDTECCFIQMLRIVSNGVPQVATYTGGTWVNADLGSDLIINVIPYTVTVPYVAENFN